MERILFAGNQIPYKVSNPEISMGVTFGIIGEQEAFLEKQGRLLFLCFLKPIINGAGHYVVEPQTRSNTRMDVVVFYGGSEYIIELKLWHGLKKHQDGLEQLLEYMESRGQKKGWILTFCFLENREKTMEEYTREIKYIGDKEIYSVVV